MTSVGQAFSPKSLGTPSISVTSPTADIDAENSTSSRLRNRLDLIFATTVPRPWKNVASPAISQMKAHTGTCIVPDAYVPGSPLAPVADAGDSNQKQGAYEYQLPTTSPFYRGVVSPACEWLCYHVIPAWIKPNWITVAGLLFAGTSWALAERGWWIWCALAWQMYAICDNLDGKQARIRKLSSAAGDYLDHVVDSFVSSWLGLIFIAAMIPGCHESSSFNISPYFSGGHAVDKGPLLPFFCLIGIGQICFYIGCWSHHVHGKLLLGRVDDPWFTVDELNFFVVPSVLLVRKLLPSLFLAPVFSLPASYTNSAATSLGFECMTPALGVAMQSTSTLFFDGSNTLFLDPENTTGPVIATRGSLIITFFVLYCVVSGIGLIAQLSKHYDKLHYLAAFICYVTTVLVWPLPPLIVSPLFAWLCSCGIFDRSSARYYRPIGFDGNISPYSHLRLESEKVRRARRDSDNDASFQEYIALLPWLEPWQIHKRYPLITILSCSILLRVVARYVPCITSILAASMVAVSSVGYGVTVWRNVCWLDEAEKCRLRWSDRFTKTGTTDTPAATSAAPSAATANTD